MCERLMKKEIVSGKYLICIVGIMLLCFTSRFPGSDVDLHEMTLMAFVTYGKSQLLQMGEMASSYSVAVSFRDMEWFIVLLPVMSVLPVVSECIFYHSVKILFQKKTGEYFLYEKNVVDESIEPYTKEEADAWLKRHKAEIEETKKT